MIKEKKTKPYIIYEIESDTCPYTHVLDFNCDCLAYKERSSGKWYSCSQVSERTPEVMKDSWELNSDTKRYYTIKELSNVIYGIRDIIFLELI